MGLNLQPKFVPVDKQTDDNIMHLSRLGKTDRLAHQALDPRAEGQMFALNLLRVPFPWLMLISVQMTRVGTPVIRVVAGEPKRLQQRFELQKDLILATPKT